MSAVSRGGGRRLGAVALTAAALGGMVSGVPAAQAAPPQPGDGETGTSDERDTVRDAAPRVFPRPHTLRARGPFVPVTREVVLVSEPGADPHALEAIRKVLRGAGARALRETGPGDSAPDSGAERDSLVVRVGRNAAPTLRALRAPAPGDLPPGGYRLAVGEVAGRGHVALDGAGADGLFHAAQTLRQLVTTRAAGTGFPGVTVRDLPGTPVRGVTEGFYGQPWTREQRLEQLDFLGRTKQNRYLYAPGDDPYRQAARWRDPYPAEQRAAFRDLTRRADANHVVFGWAVSLGQGFCFASDDDRRALLRKLDAMRALGVGAFQLQFDSVSYREWHCGQDADRYGSGPEAAAHAQSELANAVAGHLARRHPEVAPLSVMPTEFYQDGASAYRDALAQRLDDGVEVAWSGVGVVPRAITGGQLRETRAAFGGHPLVTMDNYPVNDFAPKRLFLGPSQGRDPAVADGSAALLSNAMEQPTASRVPLFTAADFAWNPRGYRPRESWRAAVDDLAGGPTADRATRAAVHALAAHHSSSVLGAEESAYLRPLLSAFWTAHDRRDGPALRRAAARLRSAFGTMSEASRRVPAALRAEARPWLTQLERFGEGGRHAVDMLTAQAANDGPAAWRAQLELRRLRAETRRSEVTVGKGVLAPFLDRALNAAEGWTGATAEAHDGRIGERRATPDPAPDSGTGPGSGTGAPRGGKPGTGGPGGKAGAASPPSARGTATARLSPAGPSGPGARPGAPVSAAVDGDPATAYRAARAPATVGHTPGGPALRSPGTRLWQRWGWSASGPGALTVQLSTARPLAAVTVQTGPDSRTRAHVEARVPGRGWKRLGPLSESGWSQVDGRGVRADAVRLVWARGSGAPVVHEVTPWYADGPDASLALDRDTLELAAGGGPAEVEATVTAHRPRNVRGRLASEAPEGFAVSLPERTTVPRGGSATVPVRIRAGASVRPGSYDIPLTFGEQLRTVSVRVFPRTGGPDLAKGARATASGEETADFPAGSVTDGDRRTRWSSPARDDAWVQVELDEPARIGAAVLSWQDAHAESYRIRVSPDGERWRTVASRRQSEGGRETVRMEAPADTRFVRIQGDRRATRFGYSLWSVELYAVRESATGNRDGPGERGARDDRGAPGAGQGAARKRPGAGG
ncbi:beta-N-acetylglucosaminidase domain-containing protein [Streptomyces sp. AJS327]|uniref:beta-N-acetylglucosaminidase domain-containing protein n=1 Tax=Streptomyces sp. AJS327 TaxID=2545265 RepID=UPI0035B54ACF